MARIVLAPDKFKGSITARDVAAQVGAGITAVLPDAELVVVPVSDGGDGLLDVALSVGFERVDVEASGPLGEPVSSWYAVRGDEVVIEMAEICGLARASDLDAMGATSRGLGEAIATALDRGANSVLLGIGGSASTDGGAGVLEALGARLLDGSGSPCRPGGGGLSALERVDLSALHPRLAEVAITVACDVDNPLTGPRGAAAVYGPQKGANPDQVAALDQALTRLADIVSDASGSDVRDAAGAGAAGGVGYATLDVLGATLRSGVDVVLDLVDFADALEGA
ncbi:MAG TPA: glycerate kinase, partial [Phycicoccus sp.]|nr:glycerate kinase [Phycicoccus sp.]